MFADLLLGLVRGDFMDLNITQNPLLRHFGCLFDLEYFLVFIFLILGIGLKSDFLCLGGPQFLTLEAESGS